MKLTSLLSRLLLPLALIGAPFSQAETTEELIIRKLQAANPKLVVNKISKSPMKGMYEAEMQSGEVLYVSADGQHFVFGQLFKVEDKRIVNLTEARGNERRKSELDKVNAEELLVYKATGDKRKATVTVFTDIDCGYCRKLHQEMTKMNELGIEVRYAAFPRAGIGSNSFKKIASVWCNDKPLDAMTKAKNGEAVPENVCDGNPVAKQYEWGKVMGVNGTPAIVGEDGTLFPGYMPAEKLAASLGI